MFDIHPPHSPIHGWRDFLIQLCTITVGLLIALALEGFVEWLHHRHVMHEAQASLYLEIKNNSDKMQSTLDRLHQQQAGLRSDVVILKKWIAHPEADIHDSIDITFAIKSFESVSWKTAQATGALALMPYAVAQQYADIYAAQDEIEIAERQAARDTTTALGYLQRSESQPRRGDADQAANRNASRSVVAGGHFPDENGSGVQRLSGVTPRLSARVHDPPAT